MIKSDILGMGKILKERRKDMGLTIVELSEKTNVSTTTISRTENSVKFTNILTLIALVDYMDIDLNKLLQRKRVE